MKHIHHLEDLIFFHPYEVVNEFISALRFNLQGESIGDLKIKVDGSPCVYWGDYDNRFFVSNKSYLNKDPVRYFSVDEIEKGKMPEPVKDKLIVLFNNLKITHRPGLVYGAELLFSSRDRTSFQPNIIKYIPSVDISKYNLGLAIHSKFAYGTKVRTIGTYNIENVYCFPMEVDLPGIVPQIMWDYSLTSYDVPSKIVASVHMKAVNKALREGGFHDSPLRDDTKIVVSELVDLKKDILELLYKGRHNSYPCRMYIDNVKTTHEGYVFSYGGITAKLVDRNVFSKANFNPETSRGWSLT